MSRFADREEAGALLAEAFEPPSDAVVLALPRGGVPVAAPIARRHGLALDVLVVRKVGFPSQPELALGAVASGGVFVANDDLIRRSRIPDERLEAAIRRERAVLAEREETYRGAVDAIDISGRTVIVVDDGIATGATVRSALEAVRELSPARIVLAVPVAPPETLHELGTLADEIVCLRTPRRLVAVGRWYDDFGPVSDDEVVRLLSGR